MLLVNTLLAKIGWFPMSGIAESRKVLNYFSLLFSSGHLEYLKVARFKLLDHLCHTELFAKQMFCHLLLKWNCVSS